MRALLRGLLLLAVFASLAQAKDPARGPRLGLVSAGTATFAAAYLTSLGLGARYTHGELGLPIFGPLVDLRRCDRCTGPARENAVIAALVIDFGMQAAGFAMVLAGIVPRRPAP